MMLDSRKLGATILGVTFALWLCFGLCPSWTHAQPKYGGTLVMAYHDPAVFNPIMEYGFQEITSLCFDGLVAFDKDGNLIPALADSWTISKDGKTYTFKLRKDVKWHDGRPFTAEDAKFSYETIINPKNSAPFRQFFESIDRVTVPDPYTAVVHLKEPNATILTRFWVGILPKHIWEKEDLKQSKYNFNPVGTGPWKLVEWAKMDHVTLEANKDYFRGRPYLDKLIMKTIPDAAVTFAALERGDIDYFPFRGTVGGIPFEQVDSLKKIKDLHINVFEISSQQHLFFRVDEPPFDNLKVRQAVAHAIDREYIIKNVLFGYGKLVHSVVPPTMKWAFNPNVMKYDYNVEKANRLLDEAGYPRKSDGIRFKTIIYGTPGMRQTFSEILREQLRVVGISAELQIADWTTYISQIRVARTHHGLWTVFLIPKLPDPDEGVLYYSSKAIGSGGVNPTMYKNPKVDEIIEKARAVTDVKERAKLYAEYQEIIARDLPTLPLYISQGVDLWNKRFEGFYSLDFGGGSATSLRLVYKVK